MPPVTILPLRAWQSGMTCMSSRPDCCISHCAYQCMKGLCDTVLYLGVRLLHPVWQRAEGVSGAREEAHMDELRDVLQDLHIQLDEAIRRAYRASYLARQLGLTQVDHQLEHELVPTLVAFADDTLTAAQPGSVGHLLALLEDNA